VLKLLRNTTAGDLFITDTGITIAVGDTYTIPPQDYWIWTNSRDTVAFIVSGDIMVNDGEDDLTNKRVAIALVQDNQMVLNEHYTLVQDDDVLVGNGQILYLNDDFDTTDNVPDYEDEQIEDDDPTES
jgi:hypothetical protein